MKLLTKAIEAKLPGIGTTEPEEGAEEEHDPMCHVKFFHPLSNWTWYAIEYDPLERLFFGWWTDSSRNSDTSV